MKMTSPRHFLAETDFTPAEWKGFIDLAADLKAGSLAPRFDGASIALIFEKTSTRTRCAFEVAAHQIGVRTTYLDPSASQVGHKESIADTAAVLGRFYSGIAFRGSRQSDVETLAQHAGVPVYNALTDEWHPTQMLADALTISEQVDKPLSDVANTYVGDARFNMGRSFLISSVMLGMDTRIIAPRGYQPPADVVETAEKIAAETGASITISEDVETVRGSDVVNTDVWVSMGEDASVWEQRLKDLTPYAVTKDVMDMAGPTAIFMHCLPAFHDTNTAVGQKIHDQFGLSSMEVTDEVFSSPQSVVFDQAENRMHTIKAVLVASLT